MAFDMIDEDIIFYHNFTYNYDHPVGDIIKSPKTKTKLDKTQI